MYTCIHTYTCTHIYYIYLYLYLYIDRRQGPEGPEGPDGPEGPEGTEVDRGGRGDRRGRNGSEGDRRGQKEPEGDRRGQKVTEGGRRGQTRTEGDRRGAEGDRKGQKGNTCASGEIPQAGQALWIRHTYLAIVAQTCVHHPGVGCTTRFPEGLKWDLTAHFIETTNMRCIVFPAIAAVLDGRWRCRLGFSLPPPCFV